MTYSIESASLVGEVYDRHLAVAYSEYESLDELAQGWPDGHYVWCTHERLEPLVNAFERFWLIERMFRIGSLPLRGRDDAFVSRAEWLRLTHELLLVRTSAIRDLAALLVAAIYELAIPDRQVSVPRLVREPVIKQDGDLVRALERLAAAAPDLRDERNQLVHEGIRRAFGESQLFDTVSHMEAIGAAVSVEPFRRQDGTTREFDLAIEHQRIAGELEAEFSTASAELRDAVMSLLSILVSEWRKRFSAKRRSKAAAKGAGPEKPSLSRRPRRPTSR